MIAIYGAIYTLAGILAPFVMGSVIQHAAMPLDGYMTGFTINAVIMVASGLLGLLLLWPNTERARLAAAAAHSRSLREGVWGADIAATINRRPGEGRDP